MVSPQVETAAEGTTRSADYVVVTVPLGVLKGRSKASLPRFGFPYVYVFICMPPALSPCSVLFYLIGIGGESDSFRAAFAGGKASCDREDWYGKP